MKLFKAKGCENFMPNGDDKINWEAAAVWVTLALAAFLAITRFTMTETTNGINSKDIDHLKDTVAEHSQRIASIDQKLDDVAANVSDVGADVKKLLQRR